MPAPTEKLLQLMTARLVDWFAVTPESLPEMVALPAATAPPLGRSAAAAQLCNPSANRSTITQRANAAVRRAAASDLGPVATDQWEEVVAMQGGEIANDRWQTQRRNDRRQDVDRLNDGLVPDPTVLSARHPDNQRGMNQFFVEPGPEPADVAMLAEWLPLIAGEDQERVIHTAQPAHGREQLAQAAVGQSNASGVGPP